MNYREQYKRHIRTRPFLFRLFFHSDFRFTCPHCRRFIDPDGKWKCGTCDHINGKGETPLGLLFGGNIRSFLSRCGKCREEPASIRCPNRQCGKAISLDGRGTSHRPAVLVDFVTDAIDLVAEVAKVAVTGLQQTVEIIEKSPEFQHAVKMSELELAREVEEALGSVYEAKLKRVATQRQIEELGRPRRPFESNHAELRRVMHDEFAADEAVAEVVREYREKYGPGSPITEKVQIVTQRWRESKIR